MKPPPELSWVEIDLGAVRNNVRELIRISGRPLMAVVKANGYGHGAVAVARAALQAGASWLGVARCSEGLELRRAGIADPILVLGATAPAEAGAAISHQLSLALYDQSWGEGYARQGAALGRRVSVHIKVDTGMGRLGILPQDASLFGKWVRTVPELSIEGVFTHFARADESDPGPTQVQIARFQEALEALRGSGVEPRWTHAANSAALLRFPESRFDLCRAGIAVYGLDPSREVPLPATFRPALTWKACLASCKALPAGWGVSYGGEYVAPAVETIAAVPVGYADGWRRTGSNQVLLGGRRLETIGRVCMDYCMVRLPAGGAIGDEVVLIGCQGQERIRAEDVALRWGTINYEVVTGIAARVPRVYLGEDLTSS